MRWFLGLGMALVLTLNVQAQTLTQAIVGGTDATTTSATTAYADDPLGRRTPRGMVAGYLDAMGQQNYDRAAEYFDVSKFPANKQAAMGSELAVNLQSLLDTSGGVRPQSMLSDSPDGAADDGLAPNLDKVGGLRVKDEVIPLLVEKTKGPDGGPLWLFSAETIKQLPSQMPVARRLALNSWLPGPLVANKVDGVPLGQWLAIPVMMALAYSVAWGLTFVVLIMVGRMLVQRTRLASATMIAEAFDLPLKLFAAAWIFNLLARTLGVSILIRPYLIEGAMIVSWLSVLLVLWRLVDVMTILGERAMSRRGHLGMVSVMLFVRHSIKVALILVAGISTLNVLGFNVTAGLAALGIGGIAIALGSQKTIENLVGSLNVVFDQPVRVGDFCKVGDVMGTIEEIGMRSTRIRTLDRTLITMPNGDFSGQRIENYAHRDRFWFHPQLSVKFDTTPAQLKQVLAGLKDALKKHDKVDAATVRVRMAEIGSSALHIKVSAYVKVRGFEEYQDVQEELNLALIEVAAKAKVELTGA